MISAGEIEQFIRDRVTAKKWDAKGGTYDQMCERLQKGEKQDNASPHKLVFGTEPMAGRVDYEGVASEFLGKVTALDPLNGATYSKIYKDLVESRKNKDGVRRNVDVEPNVKEATASVAK